MRRMVVRRAPCAPWARDVHAQEARPHGSGSWGGATARSARSRPAGRPCSGRRLRRWPGIGRRPRTAASGTESTGPHRTVHHPRQMNRAAAGPCRTTDVGRRRRRACQLRKPWRVHSASWVRRLRGLIWSCWASSRPLYARRGSVHMLAVTRGRRIGGWGVREVLGSRQGRGAGSVGGVRAAMSMAMSMAVSWSGAAPRAVARLAGPGRCPGRVSSRAAEPNRSWRRSGRGYRSRSASSAADSSASRNTPRSARAGHAAFVARSWSAPGHHRPVRRAGTGSTRRDDRSRTPRRWPRRRPVAALRRWPCSPSRTRSASSGVGLRRGAGIAPGPFPQAACAFHFGCSRAGSWSAYRLLC
jgi:hypothetical protein